MHQDEGVTQDAGEMIKDSAEQVGGMKWVGGWVGGLMQDCIACIATTKATCVDWSF